MRKHKHKLMKRFNMISLIPMFAIALLAGIAIFSTDSFTSQATSSIVCGLFAVTGIRKGLHLTAGVGENGGELTEKEKAALEAMKKSMADQLKGFVTNEDLKKLTDTVNSLNAANHADELKSLSAQVSELATKMKANAEIPVKGEGKKTISEALMHELTLKKGEITEALAGKRSVPINLSIKSVVTMGEDNTIGSGTTQYTLTQNTGQITVIRRRELTYLANVSVGSLSTERALWIEQTSADGTPIMIGEGDSKTQLSSIWQEKTATVKKIAVFGKVTTELLSDLPQLVSYIKNDLMRRQDLVLEDQYFNGNGIGDNLNGLSTYATAFSAGNLANTIVDANAYDVIQAVAAQVRRAFGIANCIFVHPDTYAAMMLVKDTVGQYVYPRWATADGLVVAGCKIVPTTAVTAGEFIGGDLSVVNVLVREELGIQIGLDGNDFTQNKITMLAEKRVVQFVSANNTGLIVDGVFDDAIADLDTILT